MTARSLRAHVPTALIQLYRTVRQEWAVNLLLKHFRHVLIRMYGVKGNQIRFRADRVEDERFYFGNVPSQIEHWQKTGGACIMYQDSQTILPHDALLFSECPRAVEMLDRASLGTRSVVVVFMPPNWRRHEEALAERFSGIKRMVAQMRFERMRALAEAAPVFTPRALEKLLARLGSSQSSFSPESPAA